jgi:hypothetical protein
MALSTEQSSRDNYPLCRVPPSSHPAKTRDSCCAARKRVKAIFLPHHKKYGIHNSIAAVICGVAGSCAGCAGFVFLTAVVELRTDDTGAVRCDLLAAVVRVGDVQVDWTRLVASIDCEYFSGRDCFVRRRLGGWVDDVFLDAWQSIQGAVYGMDA